MSDALLTTNVADLVVPEVFTPYVQQLTEDKTRLIQAGALQRSPFIDGLLAGGGLTFNVPSWRDLDNDAENTSTDSTADHFKQTMSGDAVEVLAATFTEQLDDARPLAIDTDTEIAVRLNRNQVWGTSDLAGQLAGDDPADAIAGRVSNYWARRLQAAVIATMQGVSKDNGVNDAGDYANDISGGAYVAGVTDFSAEAFLDAAVTMGDSQEDLGIAMFHSTVYNRAQKNNLIDFIPDARGEVMIATFLGRRVVVDDNMPSGTNVVLGAGTAGAAGMFETWLFGPGAIQLGVGTPKVATEITREPQAGNGGGQEVLYSRVEWSIHPIGHAYTGTAPNGGPTNAATTNNINIATSWNRVYPERKQVKFARLITRES